MRLFRTATQGSTGLQGRIEAGGVRPGGHTVEIPDVGAGHYIYDPASTCAIHGRRLEAWCDVVDPDIARDELHWHCMILSQLGGDRDEIRQMGKRLIEGRQEKRIAKREIELEAAMATVEGTVKSAPTRVGAERDEIAQAGQREKALHDDADRTHTKLDELRDQFNVLPRRAQVEIKFRLVLAVSVSFTIFDVGVMGSAFQLIPGELIWKVILTAGVALAPISTAIGLAHWLSSADLSIREGVKATRLALVAGTIGIIGIGLIVLFRAAATGSAPLPVSAYVFLAFLQSALAMAEMMLYTVYFDSKVGRFLRERISATEAEIDKIGVRAAGEHDRARRAQARISEIEIQSQQEASKLGREKAQVGDIRKEEEGEAVLLEAIVEQAIQEGIRAAARAQDRKEQEADASVGQRGQEISLRDIALGIMAILIVVLLIAGGPSI